MAASGNRWGQPRRPGSPGSTRQRLLLPRPRSRKEPPPSAGWERVEVQDWRGTGAFTVRGTHTHALCRAHWPASFGLGARGASLRFQNSRVAFPAPGGQALTFRSTSLPSPRWVPCTHQLPCARPRWGLKLHFTTPIDMGLTSVCQSVLHLA